jgi:hypothetical protein
VGFGLRICTRNWWDVSSCFGTAGPMFGYPDTNALHEQP